MGPHDTMPALPDHWEVIEEADDEHPFRLVTAPSRSFLNTTFNETPGSIKREGRPEVMIHPEDAGKLGIAGGDRVDLGNSRGEVTIHARLFDGVRRGVVIAEGVWPNDAFEKGRASTCSPARTNSPPSAARPSTTTGFGSGRRPRDGPWMNGR